MSTQEMQAYPIRRVGDMWNETQNTWFEIGMRFKNNKPFGTKTYIRPRPDPFTEGRPTGKGIWQYVAG
jgi:hypothetical protein